MGWKGCCIADCTAANGGMPLNAVSSAPRPDLCTQVDMCLAKKATLPLDGGLPMAGLEAQTSQPHGAYVVPPLTQAYKLPIQFRPGWALHLVESLLDRGSERNHAAPPSWQAEMCPVQTEVTDKTSVA